MVDSDRSGRQPGERRLYPWMGAVAWMIGCAGCQYRYVEFPSQAVLLSAPDLREHGHARVTDSLGTRRRLSLDDQVYAVYPVASDKPSTPPAVAGSRIAQLLDGCHGGSLDRQPYAEGNVPRCDLVNDFTLEVRRTDVLSTGAHIGLIGLVGATGAGLAYCAADCPHDVKTAGVVTFAVLAGVTAVALVALMLAGRAPD